MKYWVRSKAKGAIGCFVTLAEWAKDNNANWHRIDVQPWFYAKVVLFLVLLSSLSKAYKKDDNAMLVQRRAGLFIAAVALISIITLVIIKPVFG